MASVFRDFGFAESASVLLATIWPPAFLVLYAKLLKANRGEVAEWLNAAVC
jgi:hypothetical protein